MAEDHLVRLAEAIPADKYTWRPAEGVRSVSEVLLHIAGSNFNLPRVPGAAPPDGLLGAEYATSTTAGDTVIAALRQSFALLRSGIESLSEADADGTIPWFDGRNTYRGIL